MEKYYHKNIIWANIIIFGKRSERNNVKEEGKITDLYDYRHKKFGKKSEKRTVEDDINNFDDYRHKKFGNKSEKRTV